MFNVIITTSYDSDTDDDDTGLHEPVCIPAVLVHIHEDVAKGLHRACVVIIGIAVVSVVAIATTYNYKTYVVRVDNATGQVDTGGQLKSTNYVPQQAEIKHFLGQFILDTRTVPLDPVLFKNNIDRSQHYMSPAASRVYFIIRSYLLFQSEPVRYPKNRMGKPKMSIQSKW